MNNPNSYELLLEERAGEKFITPSLLAKFALGALLIVFFFKFGGWNAGCAALIILLPVGIWLLPAKVHRFLTLIYLLFAVALVSGSLIQSRLASDAVQRLAERNAVVRFFVGGYTEQICVSIILGLLTSFLVVGIPLLSVMLVSSEFVLALHEVFGVDRKLALRYLWSLIMGIQLPWEIVEDGKIIKAKPAGVLDVIGGPGVVVIRPGNAVVFDWGGKVTKIEGPGVVKTKLFERTKHIVKLGPQWVTSKVENVLTKDRIPLKFEIGIGYQIEPKEVTDSRLESLTEPKHFDGEIGGIYPVYKESVFKAVYNTGMIPLPEIVKAAAESFLRDAVFQCNLDELYDYSVVAALPNPAGQPPQQARDARPRRLGTRELIVHAIETQIQDRLQKAALDWGVQVTIVDILNMEMPQEVMEQVIQWWRTAWAQQSLVAEARAERAALREKGLGQAEALAAIEQQRMRVRNQLLELLRRFLSRTLKKPIDEDLAWVVLAIFERVSASVPTDSATKLKYFEALEELMKSEGDKTLIVGEAPFVLPQNE